MSPTFSFVLERVEVSLCLTALATIVLRKATKQFGYLALLLGTKVFASAGIWLLLTHGYKTFGKSLTYPIYFYFYWCAFAVESILMLVVICSMYRLAMAPLKGLHSLGMLVFKWVGGISILVAFSSAFSPHISRTSYLIAFVSQIQRTQSILVLCLLLFVCFAIRPMGLSYRSRIFGVSLGLGMLAVVNMIQSGWISENSDIYGVFGLVSLMASCVTLAIWTAYFVVPEPQRRLITLPTTSPFLRWNQISEILGDSPGHVAIGGLPPDMLAPAEIEVMRRASVKMKTSWAALGQKTDAA